jgi:hypothetical protein
MKISAKTSFNYVMELSVFYGIALLSTRFLQPETALFQAGLALFFVICACLVGRPAAPHDLLRLMGRPIILLMAAVVIGFGVLGGSEPHFSELAPAFGLCLLGAAFSDRVGRSRNKSNQDK